MEYMAEICDVLGLDPVDLPDFTTIYKSFNRLEATLAMTQHLFNTAIISAVLT
jgi:IS5 family transposase